MELHTAPTWSEPPEPVRMHHSSMVPAFGSTSVKYDNLRGLSLLYLKRATLGLSLAHSQLVINVLKEPSIAKWKIPESANSEIYRHRTDKRRSKYRIVSIVLGSSAELSLDDLVSIVVWTHWSLAKFQMTPGLPTRVNDELFLWQSAALVSSEVASNTMVSRYIVRISL